MNFICLNYFIFSSSGQSCRPLNFLSVGAHTLNCDLAERRTRSTVVEWWDERVRRLNFYAYYLR